MKTIVLLILACGLIGCNQSHPKPAPETTSTPAASPFFQKPYSLAPTSTKF